MTARKIGSISVEGLHGRFNYTIKFKGSGQNAIVIAPNGFGKTAFLSIINACLTFKLREAASFVFQKLYVQYVDGGRLEFERTLEKDELARQGRNRDAQYRREHRRIAHSRPIVRVAAFKPDGEKIENDIIARMSEIPTDILVRALDRTLPIVRHDYDTFRDIKQGDLLSVEDAVDRYRDLIISDPDFLEMLGPYAETFTIQETERRDCVFVETQRLLYRNKSARSPGDPPLPEEEINRQAASLADLLQLTYSNYASVSQNLDRSFPNRLIAAAGRAQNSIANLRADLNEIEDRRKALTEAGILVETAEPIVPPKDEYLPRVAQALQIYVEDSRAKLATYNDIFPKISTFKEIVSAKLKPKELLINRERGATLRRDNLPLNLEGLSSGEKHEFIMFFKLIFETQPDSLVLIDEPEISLHVLWQLEFMHDLIKVQTANRFQSIIATHSPQIFQGFDDYIVDLSEQVG